MAMAENKKDNTGLPQDGRRTEYIGAKVTAEQKRHIKQLAGKCGMTVSDYLLARAFGYRPKEGSPKGRPPLWKHWRVAAATS